MLVPTVTADAIAINSLYSITLFLAVIVFLIVQGLLIYAAAKFKRKHANEIPVQDHGNMKLELFWTVVPAFVVIMLFFLSVNTLAQMSGTGTSASPINNVHKVGDDNARRRIEEAKRTDMVIEIDGRQWFWQYKYVKDGVRHSSQDNGELIIPEGKVIRLDMQSRDVLHAWWVPSFGGNLYVNPGEMSYVWIDRPPKGYYIGQCNAYCGLQHAQMLSRVKVVSQVEFDTWVKLKKAEQGGVAAENGDAQRGAQIYVDGGYKYADAIAKGDKNTGLQAQEIADLSAYINSLK